VVGEAPGADEVRVGEPFVGKSGQLLQAMLKQVGQEWEGVWRTNVVLCRPPKNRTPTQLEQKCCAPRLFEELEQLGESVPLVALGRTAEHSLRVEEQGVWYGNRISTYHPAYVLRNPKEAYTVYQTLRKAVQIPHQQPIEPLVFVCQSVVEVYDALRELEKLNDGRILIWDLETEQRVWYRDPILCMQLATDNLSAVVVPKEFLHLPEIREGVRSLLLGWKGPNGGHNVKFDMNFLAGQWGVDWAFEQRPTIDTMLMHYVLKETTGEHGLKFLAGYYFDAPDYEAGLVGPYLRSQEDLWSKVPPPLLHEYGGKDVCYNRMLVDPLEGEVRAQGLWGLYEFLMQANWAVHKMEQRGIRMDREWLKKVEERLSQECWEHTEEMEFIADEALGRWGGQVPPWFNGEEPKRAPAKFHRVIENIDEDGLNTNSPDQLAVLMFDLLGLPTAMDPKEGRKHPRTTAANTLRILEKLPTLTEEQGAFLQELIYYRKKNKLLTAYVNNLLPILDEQDRVHTGFLIHGTETGRLSARDPALQTIPREGDENDPFSSLGNLIRGAFVPALGHKLIVADYAQAELRVAAHLSQEPFLLHAFRSGRDIHSFVTEGMFGEGWTKENRSETKRLVFCTLYGGTAYNFASDYAVPYDRAQVMYEKLVGLMPGFYGPGGYIDQQFDLLRQRGYVETILGRRRRVPLILEENRKEARKIALNAPIQGGAHELTMLSWVQLTKLGYLTMLEVHDSVLLEARESEADLVATEVEKVMVRWGEKYYPSVPWKADVRIRNRWGRDE